MPTLEGLHCLYLDSRHRRLTLGILLLDGGDKIGNLLPCSADFGKLLGIRVLWEVGNQGIRESEKPGNQGLRDQGALAKLNVSFNKL